MSTDSYQNGNVSPRSANTPNGPTTRRLISSCNSAPAKPPSAPGSSVRSPTVKPLQRAAPNVPTFLPRTTVIRRDLKLTLLEG